MPIYNAPIIKLDTTEVRRYAGLRGNVKFSDELINKACSEAIVIATPKGIWQTYTYDQAAQTIMGAKPLHLRGKNITRHLSTAKKVAIMAVTVGPQMDDAITAHFDAGEYTAAVLLDAAATAAVETLADAVNGFIVSQERRNGFIAVSRFSPGYGDWDITDQPSMLALAEAETIGVSATPSCMLLPRKSVTAIIGLIPSDEFFPRTPDCSAHNCNTCNQSSCLARKEQPND